MQGHLEKDAKKEIGTDIMLILESIVNFLLIYGWISPIHCNGL